MLMPVPEDTEIKELLDDIRRELSTIRDDVSKISTFIPLLERILEELEKG